MDLSSASLVYIASSMIAQATGRDPVSNNHSPPKKKQKEKNQERSPIEQNTSKYAHQHMTSSRPRDEP